MDSAGADITTGLISEESIKRKLPSIFVDALIVDQKFNIVVISQNVLQFLEFTSEELNKKNINYLAREEDVAQSLSEALARGYFDERIVRLYSKSNQPVRIGISGFYLGLISDINGYIVLKVRNLDELEVINSQLQLKKAELDHFIYRASHDLRGPLATIKGLLNLLIIRRNNDEIDHIFQLMEVHANKLDNRLFQLMALAQADKEDRLPKNVLIFSDLETDLRKVAEQNAFLDFLEILFSSPQAEMVGLNEILVTSLLNHLFMHLLSLPKPLLKSQVFFRMEPNGAGLNITIGVIGFEFSQQLYDAITGANSIYTDLINFPKLVNFYAAQKIAWKLKASIKVQIISAKSHRIIISVPLQDNAQLPLFNH